MRKLVSMSIASVAVAGGVLAGAGVAFAGTPVITHDGGFQVGAAGLAPGTYESTGPTTLGAPCTWTRLSLTNGQPTVVEYMQTNDPSAVTLKATDSTFVTYNCGVWTPEEIAVPATPVEPAPVETVTEEEDASGSLDLGSMDLGSVDFGSVGS
ncbi:hypothetical protein FCG67_13775 [Rhodococcus oryzae]|uniref:Secreted protein n=1 Tax=Rhodococcus oryzae TaxID=2571143 RepID=A0ABY2RI87_9NOCA|nr:hypothetical protein [Rhodococcus oryzae]TJZ76931.1 hypothetical protein FCG67_13775 [Rhodococcus oryzae]